MQFKKIKCALTKDNQLIRADEQTLPYRARCYCQSCGNSLRLRVTHTEGRFFEHDLEYSDPRRLKACCYLLPPTVGDIKLSGEFERSAQTVLSQEYSRLGKPEFQQYFCVLCNHAYYGQRKCPRCLNSLYSTEVANRDTQTVPETWAK